MDQETITFGENGVEIRKLHRYKNTIFLQDVDIDNTLISNRISSGQKNFKYIVGYVNNDYEIKPFSITLPKIYNAIVIGSII